MFKTRMTRKSSVNTPKVNVQKNVFRDSDLSDASSEDDTFQGTQVPPMTQMPKVTAASSDSDFSSGNERAPPPRANKSTGRLELPSISPILAKLARKDTSTPLKPTQQMGSSDSESDESEDNPPATQGRSSAFPPEATQTRASNTSKTQANITKASDSSDLGSDDEEAEKSPAPVRSKPQSPVKAKAPQASDSSDLDSDDEETEKSVPVRPKVQSPVKARAPLVSDSDSESDSELEDTEKSLPAPVVQPKPRSPKKAKAPQASDSSDLDSDDEETEKSVPVRPKVQSPVKARAPLVSDSDSEYDSELEDTEKSLPAPVVQPKPRSPKKVIAKTVQQSDSDDDSDDQESVKPPTSQVQSKSPTKVIARTVQQSDSDDDSDDEESVKPPTSQVQSKSPTKTTAQRKSPESESESSSDDDQARTLLQPMPVSPVKSSPVATAMEVDESSDDEAMLQAAMSRVNQAEDRARAGAILRRSAPSAHSGTDSELESKSAKGKKTTKGNQTPKGTKTPEAKKSPKGTPKTPAAKESLSFLSKEIISGSEEVSSDSEPEKLGPIRRNVSLTQQNKSITTGVKKEREPESSKSMPVFYPQPSSEDEDDEPVVDKSPGLLYLEDIGSDDEVWLLRCPTDVQRSDLIGRKLVLGGVSKFTVGDTQFESRTYQHGDDQSRLNCLLRSRNMDGLLKVVSMPTAGQVTFTRRVKLHPVVLPATTSMEGKTTPLPIGLKTRHPLFGADFQRAITVRDKTEDRPQTKKSPKKSSKKDAKRRSVTFRELPSFELTQESNQESSSEKEVKDEEEKSSEVEDPGTDDLVARMVKKALLGKQASPRKQASKKLKTPTKVDESFQPEAKLIAPIAENVSSSKRKSLKEEKSLSTSLLAKFINKSTSPSAKSAIEPSKKAIESLPDSSTSKTKRKSLKATPIAIASVFDSSDSSVSLPKTSQAKESKKKEFSNAERKSLKPEKLVSLDSSVSTPSASNRKNIANKKSPSSKAEKVTSTYDSTDSSASFTNTSHSKFSKRKENSKTKSPTKAKKSSGLINNSDSSTTKSETQLQVSSEKDDSCAESQLSYSRKMSRKSAPTLGSTVLADFLNKSHGSFVKKSTENVSVQESHSDSPSTKLKAKSRKASGDLSDSPDTLTSKSKVSKKRSNSLSDSLSTKRKSLPIKLRAMSNGSDVLESDISGVKEGKTNVAEVATGSESKKKATKSDTPSSRDVSAKSSTLSSKLKSSKATQDKPKMRTRKSNEEKPSAPEQDNLVTKKMRQVISSTEKREKNTGEESPGKSQKSSDANNVAPKKDRVAIKAKRRIKTLEPSKELTSHKPVSVDKQLLAEQKSVINELLRNCLQKQKKETAKKRLRDDGEKIEGEMAVKKSKKGQLVDGEQNTPTSSKTSTKAKPLKKYRQLTLTLTIPPGIAELSPASSKSGSLTNPKSSHKVDDLVTSAQVHTPPSKQKKKRKHDSSASDHETTSKKHKLPALTEMGSQDASFTSKFQSAGYAGPDSPLPLTSSLGASQSDIDVKFESQDSIGLVPNLDTNQFELSVKKKASKSSASRDKRRLDASTDFDDFGNEGNLVSSTQKQSSKLWPSSQDSDFSVDSQEHPNKAVSKTRQDSPFVFKAPVLSKGKRSKGTARGEESGFESEGSSRKHGELDGFESDVTLKLFRTQADPVSMAKQRAKKHLKNVR